MKQNNSFDRSQSVADCSTASESSPSPLVSALATPWVFLRPSTELSGIARGSVKDYLDSLASSVSVSQCARQRRNRKRKRPEVEGGFANQTLQLRQLYVEGFALVQIWQQALRIFDASVEEIDRDHTRWSKTLGLLTSKRRTPLASTHYTQELGDTDDPKADTDTAQSMNGNKSGSESPDHQTSSDNVIHFDESSNELADEGSIIEYSTDDESKQETYVDDAFGLNDAFFSIDHFNKQSEVFERQDSRGEPDFNSDEEEVDWHANPLDVMNLPPVLMRELPSGNPVQQEDERMVDSEDEGPIFGNADLEAESDFDVDDVYVASPERAGWVNTSDILYSDFFAPPPRKSLRKKPRSLAKTQPNDAISTNDIDRAMADVRRDLFDDELSEADGGPGEMSGHQSHHSNHEKQRARLADEIRRLEAANVAKKEWMLAGEARAVERPVNSLIEEDLDFERIGKPVPVVTAELSLDIEELVKRRIIARHFDEVTRRLPGVSNAPSEGRVRFELDDNKPQQGLAELYETDHLRAADSNYVDPKNQKLMREHANVTALWKEIVSQLDTLSNWHYKPQAPQASINVVTDVAAITMEDAQPTTSGAVNSSATLAPQEIYAPGDDGNAAGELVLKSGMVVTREEMSREQKARLRREHKKQKSSTTTPSRNSAKAAEKQQLVSDLKRGGVKLIGKQGEVTNIHGGKISMDVKNDGHALKL
ncbi:Mpp10 protein [Aspergillus heteromorphus CBS 117.55]|uniref:U3 small nucleolar ribonucleoprotein protein MPP10 n=1 Tax=Aspergillus heteromorphus CBS 117.55 TaxID=1448321 RepID=A0A317USJ1_9EURO|nr:Mpp10 protein [Aspergillus heteromorphus CBS 117.55]PWY64246.1 Mpp10 protein [Aspergillus heteromorphus CBS 117.55]